MNEQLKLWLDSMTPITDFQEIVFPSLRVLKDKSWEEGHLGEVLGDNNITRQYQSLPHIDKKNVDTLISKINESDLADINIMSARELEARKGLSLLLQTQDTISNLIEEETNKLRRWQSIRDVANFELERRARQHMIETGGESLAPFIARFLFGGPPPQMSTGKTDLAKDKSFFLARVKSGKQVAVESLHFDIPDIYKGWLKTELIEAKLLNYDAYNLHLYAEQNIAQFYYKLGFKPDKDITGYYHIRYTGYSWSKGWDLRRRRTFNENELVPID